MKRLFLIALLFLFAPMAANAQCIGGTNGTPKTAAYLLSNEFQEGGVAARIPNGCFRDLIASGAGNATNVVNLKNLGLPTGGDDTAAINTAITNAASAGVPVYAPAGTYNHLTVINLANTCLYGDGIGTIFKSTDAGGTLQSIAMTGTYTCIHDLQTTTTWTGSRQSSTYSHAIYNSSNSFSIRNVLINGSAAGGILNTGATFGQIVNNTVQNTLADAIHYCCTSHDNLTAYNYVYNPGDDCFPVVSYTGQNPVYNIRVEGNTCDHSQARGLVVVGGHDITWVGNTIYNSANAGAYLVAEADGQAEGNILVTGNTFISDGGLAIQNPTILVDGSSGNIASNITIVGNSISNTYRGCIRIGSGTSYTTNLTYSSNICTAANGTAEDIVIGGTFAAGNLLHATFTYSAGLTLPGSPVTVTYTEVTGDNAETAAVGLALAINNNTNLQAISTSAQPSYAGNLVGGNTCSTTACDVHVYTQPNTTLTYSQSTTGGATLTLASGTVATASAFWVDGGTNITVIGNQFIGPFTSGGFYGQVGAGDLILESNIWDGVTSSGVEAMDISDNPAAGWTRATVIGNDQRNDGQTITYCIQSLLLANLVVMGNQCDNPAVNITGVTAGSVQLTGATSTLYGSSPSLVGQTKFTVASGCGTTTTLLGGATYGSFHAGQTACAAVITMNGATGMTAPTGWSCVGQDVTTPADIVKQTASSTTTATFGGTVVSGDVINFHCDPY